MTRAASETGSGGSGRAGPTVLLASLGAAVMLSGIQGIAPAIPAIQQEFGLSTAQVSLITSGYLLPSVFSAFLAGMLADRVGMRPVFAGSLLLFGAGAAVLLVEHSYGAVMSVRLLQGAAFGAVMSLSIAVIGEVAPTGPVAARAQSRRAIAIAVGEALLPAVGGLLLVLSWFAPFALGLLALPLALASLLVLSPRGRERGGRQTARERGSLLGAPAIVAVQALGAARFMFKFAVITYYPVLAVNDAGMTPAAVGLTLGASALLTATAAASTERLAHRWSSAHLAGGCLALTALSLAGMAVSGSPAVLVVALLLFGAQDGVFAVAHNVMVTEMAPATARSTYVGLTGTVRNLGKVAAPLAFGAATLVVTVSTGFGGLAAASLLTVPVARRVHKVQTGRQAALAAPAPPFPAREETT